MLKLPRYTFNLSMQELPRDKIFRKACVSPLGDIFCR